MPSSFTSAFALSDQLPVSASSQLEDPARHLLRFLLEHGEHVHCIVKPRRTDHPERAASPNAKLEKAGSDTSDRLPGLAVRLD
jgi:hypothetical protein